MTPDFPGRPAIAPYLIAGSMRDARAIGPVDDVLRRQYAKLPDLHEPRHYRIGGEWKVRARLNRETQLLDLFAGIATWFLIGAAPFLAMLAWMEWAR